MSEQVFKEGDTVVLVNKTGKHVRQIDYVTKTGIVVIYGDRDKDEGGRFRQDGTATNNMGLMYIEKLPVKDIVSEQITVYAVFGDMENDIPDAYVLTEAAAKHMLGGSETGDFIALETTMDQWMSLLMPKPVEGK